VAGLVRKVPGGRLSQWVTSRAVTSADGPPAADFDSGSMSTPQRSTSRRCRNRRAVSMVSSLGLGFRSRTIGAGDGFKSGSACGWLGVEG
jgi:hypothetical protein